jgi:hypothetical protein
VQRTDPLAVGFFAIKCAGLRQRMLGIDMNESVDLAVRLRNSSKTGGRKFLGGNRTVRDLSRGFSCRQCGDIRLGQSSGFPMK